METLAGSLLNRLARDVPMMAGQSQSQEDEEEDQEEG